MFRSFRRGITLVAAVSALALLVSPLSPGATADVGPSGFSSPNVELVANIPLDTAGIGGRIVEVEGQRRLYVTSLHGLSIYDISNPELPLLMGHLEMPHWENEDVTVSGDGDTVLISSDRLLLSSAPGLLVIDTSIPQAPLVVGAMLRNAHIVSCIDFSCDWVYSSEGEIYDLRTKSAPSIGGSWQAQAEDQIGRRLRQGAHDVNVDTATGLIVTDTVPRLVLDASDPLAPVVVGHSAVHKVGSHEDSAGETAYQHNNLWPRADSYTTRDAGDASPLRDGELLLANGESNLTGRCGTTNGPFATWSMSRHDAGTDIAPIQVFRPISSNLTSTDENRSWVDGNPAVNALGCSGHWFDWTDYDGGPTALPRDGSGDYLVAAGWYEHGTRFLKVEAATGAITEVGFHQPVAGSSFAAYWATDEIAYVVDSVRGIDVLRFDREASEPTIEAIVDSWLVDVDPAAKALSESARYYCSLATA